MTDIPDRPKLKPAVQIIATDEYSGYLETPSKLHRLKGEGLVDMALRLLPLLDGERTLGEIWTKTRDTIPREHIHRVLQELVRLDLLTNGKRTKSERVKLHLLGDETFVNQLSTSSLASEHVELVGDKDSADVSCLVSGSIFSPSTSELQQEVLAEGRQFLFAGIAPGSRGFISSVQKPGVAGPCFECARIRLSANSPYSTIFKEYAKDLRHSGQHPLQPPLPVGLAASLCAWITRRLKIAIDNEPGPHPTDLILIDGQTLSPSHHRLLPVPTCRVCRPHHLHEDLPLSLGIEALCDEAVGVVHGLTVRKSSHGPNIHLSGTTSADSSHIRGTMRAVNNGGAGFSRQHAIVAGLGESAERYAAGVYQSEDLLLSSWSNLQEEAVHPATFAKYSKEQYDLPDFPFEPFTENTVVRWVRAKRLSDHEEVWVPASQVFLPYRRAQDERVIAQSISSGLAAGEDWSHAVLAGIYEVIERDALAISWLRCLPPRKIPETTISRSVTLSRHLAERKSWKVKFFDLSLDSSATTIAAAMESSSESGPILSFGSATRLTSHKAAEKAFLEAAQGQTYIRRLLPTYTDWKPGSNFEHVVDFNHHGILYSKYPNLRREAKYLVDLTDSPPDYRPAIPDEPMLQQLEESPSTAIRQLVTELNELGHEIYVVDITPIDLRMAGVTAVRVLIPGFMHLSGTHTLRLLGTNRLQDAPSALGYSRLPINEHPHPLP